jgi:hypothetical protein
VRTLSRIPMTATPFAAAMPACPSPTAVLARESAVTLSTRPVHAAAQGTTVLTETAHGRVPATGVGYAGRPDARVWREIRRDVPNAAAQGFGGNGTTGTTSKQQDQLHLMSRRDPRTWRPPA